MHTSRLWVSHFAKGTMRLHWELLFIVTRDKHILNDWYLLASALTGGYCPECGVYSIDSIIKNRDRITDVWTMGTREWIHMGKLKEVVPTLRLLPNTSYDVIVDGSVEIEEQTVSTRDGRERRVSYFMAKTTEGSPIRIAAGEQLRDKIAIAVSGTKGPVKLHISRDPTGFYYEVTRL